MMQIHFNTLVLQCKRSREIIDLTAQVNFFHGKVSSGKSSIARLINFCLGGGIEKTIAIQKEVISVSLELIIGKYEVLLERNTDSSSSVNATCIDESKKSFTINVPITAGDKPIWADKVYNLSDLVFYLLDINVLRIPQNKNRDDANLVRISLRNFMWYCYLDQSKLDNSFFRHEDSSKTRNSKEVLKYILQYSTQKLIELQEKRQMTRKSRFAKHYAAEGLRDFLKKFSFSSETEIDFFAESIKEKLTTAKFDRTSLEKDYSNQTHSVDHIRVKIRNLIEDIVKKEQGILDLELRINQQETLRSELISSKFKIARSQSIASIFQDVEFKNCPDCGTSLVQRKPEVDKCNLCLSPINNDTVSNVEQTDIIQSDLTERVRELDSSIDLHKKELHKTRKEYLSKQKLRKELDEELEHSIRQYESVFLSNIRSIDKRIATLQERLKGLERLKAMPLEIKKLEDEISRLIEEEKTLKRQIDEEQANFIKGDTLIDELEEKFLEVLSEVGMPGISRDDKVNINRRTWDVTILPAGEDYLRWNFYNAGSGGKKTLFNSCFLLALHIVAATNDLPLPSFIIIDTPMKNIDKEVNQDIFKSFYDYLYKIAGTVLDNTQVIIIDNNYIPPSHGMVLSFKDRYMEAGDVNNPPLISYYVGP